MRTIQSRRRSGRNLADEDRHPEHDGGADIKQLSVHSKILKCAAASEAAIREKWQRSEQ
jgi:hypothetical protein